LVVGCFEDSTGYRRGFIWDPGQLRVIVDILWDLTGVNRVNNDVTIVGIIPRDDKFHGEIFRWTLPEFVTQSVTADPEILADATHSLFGKIDINTAGEIAGTVSSRGYWRPAWYTDGTGWELVHANNNEWGFSEAINAEGHICGRLVGRMARRGAPFVFFGAVGDSVHGFWLLDELVVDPENLWMAGDGNDDSMPLGISDADGTGYGTIVGYKVLGADVSPNGESTRLGFVLIPQ
jgi:hypothetical protein